MAFVLNLGDPSTKFESLFANIGFNKVHCCHEAKFTIRLSVIKMYAWMYCVTSAKERK